MEDFKPSKRWLVGVLSGLTLIVLLLGCNKNRSAQAEPASKASDWIYSTQFPATENPISENRHWSNGQTVGLDWANVRTKPGFAFGTEYGRVKYDDSTALLQGSWGPDQTVQATVRSLNQNDKVYEEVELRLRSTLSAHRATGYEITFRCSKTEKAYTQIVRWNGSLGDFTYLNTADGSRFGVKNGDVVKASISGDLITVYINGIQVLQATDHTYTSGNPGMGFYLEGASSGNDDFGLASFAATDGSDPTHSKSN